MKARGSLLRFLILTAGFLLVLALLVSSISTARTQPPASGQWTGGHWGELRSIAAADLGLLHPVGLTYSPSADLFFALEAQDGKGAAELTAFTPFEDPAGSTELAMTPSQPLNTAFYEPTGELIALSEQGQVLAQVEIGPGGDRPLSGQRARHFSMDALQIADPQGMSVDAAGGRLFVLDGAGSSIIVIQADGQHAFDGEAASRAGRVERIALRSLENVALRGIAFNPSNGHLYVGSPAERKLYELTETGELLSVYDLAEMGLRDPQGMVFAPSADRTDNPAVYHLYLADSGLSDENSNNENSNNGHIVELSFEQPAAPAQAPVILASLVNTIDTSKASWDPSSPDPAGIAYRSDFNRLLVVDSDVDEGHPDFEGKNVFQSSLRGNLVATCNTLAFSDEPTGAAVNPNNRHFFLTDDNNDHIFEIAIGTDGIYCTADDVVTPLDLRLLLNLPNGVDPEGVAYGANRLFVADGIDREVYIVNLGANGVIGGTGTNADRVAGHFDVQRLGINEPEGIEYNPDNNTLFIVSTKVVEQFMQETTLSGMLVKRHNLSFLGLVRRSGLAYAPGSQNPALKNLYIASRGVDNSEDPDENDGKIYEVALDRDAPREQLNFLPATFG
jgi:DNA-binding beta-propeller fold protein YncE